MVSLTYSLTLAILTLAVLLGHKVFSGWPAHWFVLALCLVAASGAIIAAYAPVLPIVWFGYSLLFGAANGLGYGFGLQIAAQANPGHEGKAMGIVTACYGLGAALSPAMFTWLLSMGGFKGAMFGLTSALLVTAVICSSLFLRANATFQSRHNNGAKTSPPYRILALLWIGFGAGVGAGLMAIGHATGIATSLGFTGALWITPVLIALCNMCGSFVGGWLVDRIGHTKLLVWLPLLSSCALSALVLQNNVTMMIICLGFVGFTYGATISVYPATITKMFGALDSPGIYGKVFTAWGSAGLLAPWLAGLMFDQTGGYAYALLAAALLGIISALAIILMLRGNRHINSGL